MSASRKLCLSRKRERELCPEGKHDISDDFQEAATGFRLPKRLRSGKSQGKSKRTMHDLDTEENPASIANKDPPDENTTNASPQDQHLQEHENETSIKENDLQEMEKMLCSESEKLCPSCKVIVPSAVFTAHFKECLQKFKWTRGEYKQKLPEDDREGETNQQEEQLPVLPCPVCKKPFKSKVQRVSHIKACAQGHGLTSEQLLLASRLLEKQTEEWSELGLPSIQQPQNTKPKPQKSVKHTEDLNDPDIAMALALSRSIVEEEVESRTSREEKLFALGMEDIVNEERKVKPVLLPPLESVISNMRKQGKKTARNRKGCGRIYNTALVTRSVEERERLISEKVAVLLTSTDTAEGGWTNSETPRHSTRLVPLVNKPCQLWEAARSGTDEPIHSFYVPDLEPYIIPKERVIGSLFRHLSQVPGRVNTTALHAMDEKELQKYGICPLKRKKAVMVLQHVFEQTHPFVTDSETETSFSQTPKKYASRPKKLQSQMKKRGRSGPVSAELKSNKKNATKEVTLEESASPVKEGEREKDDSEESQLNSSFSSVSSEGSSGYLFGETMFSPEEEDNLSSTQQADLTSQMREMIVNNSDLHRKVLQYEPIFVEDLHAILKSNKIKCSIQALLDVLDDLCLIVRTQANQNRGQMRASRKRKNISQRKNS
ncbi:structure-specific endonuclease subunit SLX4-like isoform X6 [Portunus trituberculatus]|uniref:structure-specific endonuclease subunit SLX4-like isoform X6 n=1 Tax=Portunus trituberculatus TaxID=210409 RepID=UPI001E1CEB3B|nr:structure-specific endonuclease subunit SLX4-like isoform X6 [Portunus trituberculatus]